MMRQPLTPSLVEILTVNMSPCFSFILVRKLAASLPNSKAWPSQGMLPRSKGGSPGRLRKPQHLAPRDKARERQRVAAMGKSEEALNRQLEVFFQEKSFPARGTA